MVLIVGLGNPGEAYKNTRHNFGFLVADALAKDYDLTLTPQAKFSAEMAELNSHKHKTSKILLAKPQTFMNLSGEAVGALARFYKIEPKHIWVIADDLDLPLGKIRARHGGESGGHHGLESIEDSLGSKDFCRVRMGIRGSETRQEHLDNNIDTNSFVTGQFSERERPLVNRTLETATEILKEAIQIGQLKAHTYEVDGFDDRSGANNA